jgi:ABC-type antimicrobial peptide transport system permease subunit
VASVSVTDQVKVDILCPIGWAKDKHAEADVDFSLDSASFTVADPLNLDAFKAAMNHYNLHEVSSTAEFSVEGNSLSVEDETFIKTAGRVKNNLTVQYAFAPVIFLVIALIGYALAYLLMQGRRTDIAIMRSLGASRRVCVLIMFIEYAMLGLAGCLLGTACAAIWMKPGWSTLLIALLFLASLILGVLAATFQISKGNTMMGLIKTES